MNKWKPGDLPNSISEYGFDHQIWTDKDVAVFCSIALVVGFVLGYIL
jgi:hypothetical protein